jgi:hypothetical protein
LGDGTTQMQTFPVQIGSATDWSDVCAGGAHTAALKSDGSLWTWGSNLNGQLADGSDVRRRLTPLQVPGPRIWGYLPRGGGMTACTTVVTQAGLLLAAGDSTAGMLGTANDQSVPRRIHPVQLPRDLPVPTVTTTSNVVYNDVGWSPYAGSQRDLMVSGPALLSGFITPGPDILRVVQRTGPGYVRGVAFDRGDDNWTSSPPIEFPIPSGNATLSSLSLDSASLSPGFSSSGIAYTALVGATVDSIRVKAAAYDPGSAVNIGASTLLPGVFGPPVALTTGDNVLSIVSLAEDGVTQKTYQITVKRETPYQTWARSVWGTNSVAELDDADMDGLPNLLEYAMGSDPRSGQQASPVTPSLATIGNQTFLRVCCSKGAGSDVVLTAEATGDLGNPASWSSAGLVVEEDSATRLTVRDFVPFASSQPRFMRIKAIQN